MKRIKPIDDYDVDHDVPVRLIRRERVYRMIALYCGVAFILGAIAGLWIAYNNPMIKSRNEAKILQELKVLRSANSDLTRQNSVLYATWTQK